MILVIDNTQDESKPMFLPLLLKYMEARNVAYTLVSDKATVMRVNQSQVQAVVLSGSPLMVPRNKKTNIDNKTKAILNLNMYVVRHYSNLNIPILGICFGCQFLNTVYGNGTLRKLKKQCCRQKKVNMVSNDENYQNVYDIKAKFCCSYVLNKVATGFQAIAHTIFEEKKTVCAIKHLSKKIYGVLYHPEYLEDTHFVLDSILDIKNQSI